MRTSLNKIDSPDFRDFWSRQPHCDLIPTCDRSYIPRVPLCSIYGKETSLEPGSCVANHIAHFLSFHVDPPRLQIALLVWLPRTSHINWPCHVAHPPLTVQAFQALISHVGMLLADRPCQELVELGEFDLQNGFQLENKLKHRAFKSNTEQDLSLPFLG